MKCKTHTCPINNIRLMLVVLYNGLKILKVGESLLKYRGLLGYINEFKYRFQLCLIGPR